jgi:hypothetical protein
VPGACLTLRARLAHNGLRPPSCRCSRRQEGHLAPEGQRELRQLHVLRLLVVRLSRQADEELVQELPGALLSQTRMTASGDATPSWRQRCIKDAAHAMGKQGGRPQSAQARSGAATACQALKGTTQASPRPAQGVATAALDCRVLLQEIPCQDLNQQTHDTQHQGAVPCQGP